jgi:hypothetical protein
MRRGQETRADQEETRAELEGREKETCAEQVVHEWCAQLQKM